LSKYIRVTRIEKRITIQELAERAGISRGLLSRIENGDPGCSIGVVFEIASILGMPLFSSDYDQLLLKNKIVNDKMSLLPSEVRKSRVEVDDDF